MEYSYYDHENTFLSGTLFCILTVTLLKAFFCFVLFILSSQYDLNTAAQALPHYVPVIARVLRLLCLFF